MVQRALGFLALLACAALVLTPAAGASWQKPTAGVSGEVRISWTSTLAGLWGPSTVDGVVRYDVVGRAQTPTAPREWSPLEMSPVPQRGHGFLLRSRVTVERYTVEEPGRVCGDGQTPGFTTTATGALAGSPAANGLLNTDEPELDLVRRRGTVDVDLVAFGTVRTRATGTGCASGPDGGGTVRTPAEPSERDIRVGAMLGDELVRHISTLDNLPVTVGANGSFTLRAERRLRVDRESQGEVSRGTITFDLKAAGPPSGQSSMCTVPTSSEIRRLRTPADVRRLARRKGFTRIGLGPSAVRGPSERSSRYRFTWGSPAWPCGGALGTRKAPALFPLRSGR